MLDEVKSNFHLTILDASYVEKRTQAHADVISRVVARIAWVPHSHEASPTDEVHMVPVARTRHGRNAHGHEAMKIKRAMSASSIFVACAWPRCTNPLEERRAKKKKGEPKDELTSEEPVCLTV